MRMIRYWTLGVLLLATLLAACAVAPAAPAKQQEANDRQKLALAIFSERCKRSGEFVHRTVDDVDGIFLLKIRPKEINYADQFALTDPYGEDLGGEGYISSFLRGFYRYSRTGTPIPGSPPPVAGYEYVDAVDPGDGTRYRYTGRIEEPWQTNKSFLKGHLRFVTDRAPTAEPAPRYAVTYEDISTREDREHWIAGSSLKVIDLRVNEVIAERVGYAVDSFQGSRAGGRAPWLMALDTACPSLLTNPNHLSGPASAAALYRSARFVEKVLRPRIQ